MELVFEDEMEILRTKCNEFDFENPAFNPTETAESMFFLMLEHEGMGLSAPQVGLHYRLFVMRGNAEQKLFCFNPKITEVSGDIVPYNEGCLSFPNLKLAINRPEQIVAEWQDEKGERQKDALSGIFSRCFQHEIDHLQGILFIDHLKKETTEVPKINN